METMAANKPGLSPAKLRRLLAENASRMTMDRLWKHLVALRTYRSFLNHSPRGDLFMSGFLIPISSHAATGYVPADPWFLANIETAMKETRAAIVAKDETMKRYFGPVPEDV